MLRPCIAFVASLALATACGSKKDERVPKADDSDQTSNKTPPVPDEPAGSPPEVRGKVGLDVKLPEPDKALATRCAVPGPALTGTCRDEIRSIAVTTAGKLYLVDEANDIRRYDVAAADANHCELALDTTFGADGVMASPPDRPTPQSIDGPVYMRSGGPDYAIAASTNELVFVYDFLLGVYRVRDDRLEPVCIDQPGIRWFGLTGDAMTAIRNGELYEVKTKNKGCTLSERAIDAPLAISAPAATAGAALYVAGRHAETSAQVVARIVNGAATAVYGAEDAFAPGGLCSINAVAECGDRVCVADGNCRELDRFTPDGEPAGTTKLADLVGDRVYGVADMAAAGDGGLWIAVTLRTDADSATCEGAVFRLR